MVEQIVERGAKLKPLALRNLKVLRCCQVDVPGSRTTQPADARAAKSTNSVLSESSSVEPLRQLILLATAAGQLPVSQQVRRITADSRQRIVPPGTNA